MAKIDLFYRTLPFEAKDFKGEFDGVKIENGVLVLDGAEKGTFVSEPITVTECNRLLVSWNAKTNGGTCETFISYKKADGSYSEWFSFGIWSSKKGVSASRSGKSEGGKMDSDTLDITEKTTCVKVKVELAKLDGEPEFKAFYVTNNGKPRFEIDRDSLPAEAYCDVRVRSQMHVPVIGNIICSPTSTSMLLEYLGTNLESGDVAAACFDNGDRIYGNWLFNVAFAGEQGYVAHYDSYDVEMAMHALANGVPMAFSIKTAEGQIKNAPQAYRNGHLIVVVGYKYVDGELYFIVNDPSQSDIKECRREYNAKELESGWKNHSVYVYR